MRVIEVTERGQRVIPRTDLVDADGRSLILPETRELRTVEITDVANGARLMVRGLVGHLPLTSTITLNIVPKFPIQNFWKMLEIGCEDYKAILPVMRGYQSSASPTPLQMLARSFCHYLRQALSAGIERTYYPRLQAGYYRPRVVFGPTIARYLSRGNPVDTVSLVHVFGLDSPANRIVKAACLRFIRVIPRTADWNEERDLLQSALDSLQSVNEREVSVFDADLDPTVSMRLRPHYAGMSRVYRLLQSNDGIAFAFEPGGTELPSFLFNLEDIFERFVRQTLLQGLRETGIAVLNGEKHQGHLFEDSTVFKIKPDMLFRRSDGSVIGLGDSKYKTKLKEADRYQIITHVTAKRASFGILFSPANDGESQGMERIGRLATGAQFFRYNVDIQGDIAAAQTKMIQDVSALMPKEDHN